MRNRLLHHKSLAFLQCCLSVRRSSNGYRCFNSVSTNPVMDDCCDDPVVVEGNGCSRTALLNRPSSLNAINKDMAVRLQKLYKDWEDDHDVRFVVLKGRGRAFCAGGDLISLYNLMKQGNIEESKQIFWNGYGLIYLIASYVKPHVAILNGITMGGGAGISIPGTFRVATDKTLFATPEVLIGFHPDSGASYYLSRLPGYLGEYLAMTGDKLNGSEMISCGLATHYTHTTKLPMVERALGNLVTSDHYLVGASLQKFQDPVHIHHNSLIHKMETVDRCFSHDTVEEIIESLENEAAQKNDQWCASTLRKLKEAAPLSLKVSLRSIREGRTQTLEQCLTREYRMTIQAMSKQITTDFYEGIRAKLVDEDVVPKWDPPTLEHVSQDMVNQYFSDLSPLAQELELPKLII